MAQTKPLGEKLADDLRTLADTLGKLADTVASATPTPALETEQADKAETNAVAPTNVTLEQVRVVLADKSRAGLTVQVRELLLKHGAAKLSEIDPAKYLALLEEAEGLTDG